MAVLKRECKLKDFFFAMQSIEFCGCVPLAQMSQSFCALEILIILPQTHFWT